MQNNIESGIQNVTTARQNDLVRSRFNQREMLTMFFGGFFIFLSYSPFFLPPVINIAISSCKLLLYDYYHIDYVNF